MSSNKHKLTVPQGPVSTATAAGPLTPTSKAARAGASEKDASPGGNKASSAGNKQVPQVSTPEAPKPLDPVLIPDLQELRQVLTENPEGFQVSLFIEKLIKPLLDPGATRPGRPIRTTDFGFDPVALHEMFTGTLEKLGKLGKEVDDKISTIQDEASKCASQRKREIDRHHRSLQEVRVPWACA